MVRGKVWSSEIVDIVTYQSEKLGLNATDIARLTDMRPRTVRDMLERRKRQYSEREDDGQEEPPKKRGRPRHINTDEHEKVRHRDLQFICSSSILFTF
jgi:hypothetical protein